MNIVLFQPLIPQNTGTIGRLCVCNDFMLHLIHPLGFELDETRIKRAGIDYWQHIKIKEHKSWSSFLVTEDIQSFLFLSTKGKKSYFDYSFAGNDYIIFGNESHGLSKQIYEEYADDLYTIPMLGKHARSHNLANAVSIVVYEAIRQNHY